MIQTSFDVMFIVSDNFILMQQLLFGERYLLCPAFPHFSDIEASWTYY